MHDAAAKVKGTAQFTDDIVFPGMLYGKILRSPLPHARILHIDTSRAAKLPGVKGVVTGQDIPDRPYGIVPKARDEHALARGKVRYIGDDVAAVCAIDPEIAEEALELIKVEYEELPAVFDPLEAIKEGAPLVHDGVPNNISFYIKKEFGAVEKAFSESDYCLRRYLLFSGGESRPNGTPCGRGPIRSAQGGDHPLLFHPDPFFLKKESFGYPHDSRIQGPGH